MAGLAGFEPAPHVVAVGFVERVAHFLARFIKGIERVLKGNSIFYSRLYSNKV